MRRQPFDFPATAAIIVIAVLATIAWQTNGSWLVRRLAADRTSVVVGGEVWRLFTGPFFHANAGHVVRDLVVVAVIGVGYERPLRRVMAPLVVASLSVPALAVLLFESGVTGYLGLSGMSHAWIAAALTYEILVRPRWLPVVVSAGLVVKLIYEQTSGPAVIPTSLGLGASPAPIAHAAGAIAGAVVLLAFRRRFCGPPAGRSA